LTIKLAVAGLLFGLSFGLLGAVAKLSRFSLLRVFADICTTVVCGIPELLLVLFVYFGGSVIINKIAAALGYNVYIDLNAFAAGFVAIGTTFAAYASEVFRGAILAVPKGQVEAARALGMPGLLIFRRVVLPQVWRFALPGLGNLFLVLQKNTALVSVIGLQELMRNAGFAVGYTKKPFTFYMVAALIYLALTIVSMAGMQVLEKRSYRGVRRV
jgi:His/Glu/Gln/Arg/opine family amino acid ABC transporter permease subunit